MASTETPSSSADAEAAVLGSILRKPDVVALVSSRLRPDDFYSPAHREVFRCMAEMLEAGQPIDVVTVGERLAAEGKLVTEVGGAPALVRMLFDDTLTAANVEHYCDCVRTHATLRRIEQFHRDGLSAVLSRSGSPEVLLAELERKLARIATHNEIDQVVSVGQLCVDLAARMDESRQPQPKQSRGLRTGIKAIDSLIELRPGEMTVVGARPGAGKSAFGLGTSVHAACSGAVVLFVSLEMSGQSLVERFVAMKADVNLHFLRTSTIGPEEVERVVNAFDSPEAGRILVMDASGATLRRIVSAARRLHLRQPLGLVVIDYLGLIEPEDRRANRWEQVTAASRGIKQFARSLDVPVLALAQLNRELEKRADPRPILSDLRESGSIEQDADVVLLLHRPSLLDSEVDKAVAEIYVAKNRSGPVGRADVTFRPEFARFENRQEDFRTFAAAAASRDF